MALPWQPAIPPSIHGYRPALIHKRYQGNAALCHWWNLGIAAATGMGSGSPSHWFSIPPKPCIPVYPPTPTHSIFNYPFTYPSVLKAASVHAPSTQHTQVKLTLHDLINANTSFNCVQMHTLHIHVYVLSLRQLWRMQRSSGGSHDPLSLLQH